MDITTALAQAKRPEKVVQICLRGDLRAEFERADAELQQVERTALGAPSLADGGRRRELVDRIESLRQQMLAESVEFTLRAVSRGAWVQLVAAHHKPEGGVDSATFLPVVLRACLVDPELTEEQWAILDDTLTSAQYEVLSEAAWALNRGDVDVPFSPTASRIVQSSEAE